MHVDFENFDFVSLFVDWLSLSNNNLMMRRAGLFKSKKHEDVLYWNSDAFDAQPLSRRCAEENKGLGMKQSLLSRSKRKWKKFIQHQKYISFSVKTKGNTFFENKK